MKKKLHRKNIYRDYKVKKYRYFELQILNKKKKSKYNVVVRRAETTLTLVFTY